jgi:hypothetical protein
MVTSIYSIGYGWMHQWGQMMQNSTCGAGDITPWDKNMEKKTNIAQCPYDQ